MSVRRVLLGVLLLALTLFATSSTAAPPNRINFQGLALDPSGIPIQGNQSVILRVWSDPVSLAPAAFVYGEQHAVVAFIDGVFQIAIGSGVPIAGPLEPGVFSQSDRWIELQIASEILAPRQRVESTAYALQCANSDSVGGIPGASLITGVSAGSGLVGGGSSGDVSLSLAANGVGTAQIVDNSITSLDIADGTITSADIASNTITSFDMAIDSITSANIVDGQIFEQDIANEAGVDFVQAETLVSLSTSDTVVLSTVVSAPSDGFIVASASLGVTIDEISFARCSLTLDSAALDSSAAITQSGLADGSNSYAMAFTRGFVVAAPGGRVVRLVCASSPLGTATVNDRQLTAIFAPTRY
jgi:hypothetical protein